MSLTERLQKLEKLREDAKCDLLFVDESKTLYYLTGIEMSAGRLLVTSKGAELLVDGRYFEMCSARAPMKVTLSSTEIEKERLRTATKIGFDSHQTYYATVQRVAAVSGAEMIGIDNLHHKLRIVKSDDEIAALKRAAVLGGSGFDYVLTLLKEGITEKQVARALELFWIQEGGDKLAFEPIIAFGKNSSMPHYRSQEVPLKRGDTVLIDIGVTLDHYHSDMTRTVFFGQPSAEMQNIYEVVRVAQQKAMDACIPGMTSAELDAIARDHISSAGYGEEFCHSLGHGVGLDLHELPTLRKIGSAPAVTLQPGMVITLEPGVYVPGLGGVRIEDTVAVTATGCVDLTLRPKELKVIAYR